MWRSKRFVLLALMGLGLSGCAAQRAAPPDPAVLAAHEWDHGPPWGLEEQPWVAPPAVLLAGDPYYGYGYGWGPRVGIGLGIGVSRGHWWGHRGWRGPSPGLGRGMARGGFGHHGRGRGGRR